MELQRAPAPSLTAPPTEVFVTTVPRTTLLLGIAVAFGCSESPMQRSFSENVGLAFEECNAAEIRFVAAKHNLSPAFDWCGSNNFSQFSWSPDGRKLYFVLSMAHHVMDAAAEDKATLTVPTQLPVGRSTWLDTSRLAIPLGPAEGTEDPRIAVYDLEQQSLFYTPLPRLGQPDHLQRGEEPAELLFTALGGDGQRRPYRIDLDSGEVTRTLLFVTEPVDSFTYAPELAVATIGRGDTVTAWDHQGTVVGQWSPATRGSLHASGEWMMLEHSGEPISIFSQRTWDELSERARARELRRTKSFEERLPKSYPREVAPPTLSVAHMGTGERVAFHAFYGSQFEWYEPAPDYGSFVSWGFEGKQFNRNVLLGSFSDRLRAIREDEKMMGLQPMDPPSTEVTGPAADPTPASPAAQREAKTD